ncbi:hypothetical protein C2S53_004302 [Perilla frutescens var. hirtella]|uniref:F-box associated beta-propeller type 1 domain-containing protein n=1 Tax=Perilla frutescens var. hirtella TaxID=608512 RepID=A0AAD4IP73_PERFH|nr:hypothetical protein C2S53_004302 [Perilla frutescens var. hirtella]
MRILSKKKNNLLQLISPKFNFRRKLNAPSSSSVETSTCAGGNNQKLLLKRFSPSKGKYEFSVISPENLSPTRNFSLPYLPFPQKDLKICRGCNGLLYVYNELGLDGAIWNPSSMEFKPLPPSDKEPPPNTAYSTAGVSAFGYDSKAQDYKVLRFVDNHIENGYCDWPIEPVQTYVELYSFKSNSWKGIHGAACDVYGRSPYVYVGGCSYWNAEDCIVSFDFATETLSCLNLPDISDGKSELYDSYLVDFYGVLGYVVYPKLGSGKTLEIWMANGPGWLTEDLSIVPWCLWREIHVSGDKRLLEFWDDDHLLFLEVVNGNSRLLLLDETTNKLKKLDINGDGGDPRKMEIIPYEESMTPINEQLGS